MPNSISSDKLEVAIVGVKIIILHWRCHTRLSNFGWVRIRKSKKLMNSLLMIPMRFYYTAVVLLSFVHTRVIFCIMGVHWSVRDGHLEHFCQNKCIIHHKRTPALVILFQHFNKDGELSCSKERNDYCRVALYMKKPKKNLKLEKYMKTINSNQYWILRYCNEQKYIKLIVFLYETFIRDW